MKPIPSHVLDRLGRPVRNLRISVTDRCNLRCGYCMPEADYQWLPREDILTFEEIDRVVRAFTDIGVHRIRLTGGEPLIRKDLPDLVRRLAAVPGIDDVALTTNGLLFPEQGAALRDAGLQRVTFSLDTVDTDRFARMTARDQLDKARAGIEAAVRLGLPRKINAVVLRGENDVEVADLLLYGRTVDAEVRFIEYMDVGGATRWKGDLVVSRDQILAAVEERFGPAVPVADAGSAPARRWRLADGTVFGIIASTTAPFCASCDRSRLTADGRWFTCLYARQGKDLRDLLRSGADRATLVAELAAGWGRRDDRGAEERAALAQRGALAKPDELASDPHLEMHTRGG